jgi:hypothetical protein
VANASPAASEAVSMLETAFYCIADRRHFLGAVALLNSLRVVGHDEPFFLVDAGMTSDQRKILNPHVTLIDAPNAVHPVFLKPHAPIEHPAQVAILLDADIIVTRPLTGLIDTARRGRLVGFLDNPPHDDRFFPEWSEALGLGPLRRQPYLNAGYVFVPYRLTESFLRAWNEAQMRVDVERTWFRNGKLSDPLYFADMDALNAVAASSLSREDIVFLEHRLAPAAPFPGLKLVDEQTLHCAYADGTQPYMLHHILGKPWLTATRTTVYSVLMTRLLLGTDVTVRLEPSEVPLRLREGRLAAFDRRRADIQAAVRSNARRQLGRFGIRTRLAAWRDRRAVRR